MTRPGNLNTIRHRSFEQQIGDEIKSLRRQIKELVTAQSLNYASVTNPLPVQGGQVVVKDDAGNIVSTEGTDVYGTGVRFYRPDGTLLFESMGDSVAFGDSTFTAIHDRNGNMVVNDDGQGGGLGRPFIPLGTMVSTATPTDTTTSTSWTPLQTMFCSRWHPRVMWQVLVSSSNGTTTGNVRLVDAASNVIGSPITVPAGVLSYVGFSTPQPWPTGTWTPGDSQYLTVQAQVTAGTGSIGARTTGIVGWLEF